MPRKIASSSGVRLTGASRSRARQCFVENFGTPKVASTTQPACVHSFQMQPVKAHVKNGRLVVDEPTDRPEGDVVELVPLDEVLAHGGDYLDDDERAALRAELEASIAEAKSGQLVDADVVLADLRATR
jgi:hypothetical protein